MFRIALYVSGMAVALVGLIAWQDRARARRLVPVNEAAEQLRRAWADNHTRA
jgi:hypothetical protein